MKKIIYAFCVVAFASIFVLSCSGDEFYDANSEENLELGVINSSEGNQRLEIPDQYKLIGEKHNEGLEAAFMALKDYYKQSKTRLSKNDTLGRLSKEEYLVIAQQGLNDFCNENIPGYSVVYEKLPHNIGSRTRTQGEAMSGEVLRFLEKIKGLLNDEPESLAQLVKDLNEINKEATAKLSEINAIAIYAGTSTCYNSYLYWKENRMKWFIMLNCPDLLNYFSDEELNHFVLKEGKLVAPIHTRSDSWWDKAWSGLGEAWDSSKDYVSDWWNNGGGKEVVGTDAGDAVKGVIEGALLGAYVDGWGAIPGAVIGGVGEGAAGSISAAVQYWIAN